VYFTINDFSEIMYPIVSTYGDEILSFIVIQPFCTW
jgi:hypothetical protein